MKPFSAVLGGALTLRRIRNVPILAQNMRHGTLIMPKPLASAGPGVLVTPSGRASQH
jgi:hypothetical protein